MINIKKGNLLENVEQGIIVHGANAQGVMGAGFAKQFKTKFPFAFYEYQQFCQTKELGYQTVNDVLGHCVFTQINDQLTVVSAIIQRFYGFDKKLYVDYKAVKSCFENINRYVITETELRMNNPSIKRMSHGIITVYDCKPEIHFPMIGAGLAGGDWKIIEEIIEETIDPCFTKNLWVLK